jgi:glutathione S-transferase
LDPDQSSLLSLEHRMSTTSRLKIYGKKKSRANRCLWALEEVGLPYEHIPTDQDSGENRTPEYLAINPSGKVPTLVDGDFVLTESLAINLYLAGKKPELLPSTPRATASMMQWTLWAATEPEYQLTMIVREMRRGDAKDPQRIAAATEGLRACLKTLETHLAKGTSYILGDTFTIADLNVASVLCVVGMMGVTLDAYPAIDAWMKRCLSRPAWLKVQS